VIVRGLNGTHNSRVGTLVTVESLHVEQSFFGPVWNVTHMRPIVGIGVNSWNGAVNGVGRLSASGHCPDAWLRPIRDSGDGADDESHAWLPPVPALEHA